MDIRPATDDELPFVYDSWCSSYRKSPYAGCIPNHLYESVHRACIDGILARGAAVLVASAEYDAGQRVMGYSVSEPARRVLHWLYVKSDFRNLGVGHQLLAATCPEGEWTYTHKMRASVGFLGNRFRWDDVAARIK